MVVDNPEMMQVFTKMILVSANGGMGMSFVGLAQAAYDEALAYAKLPNGKLRLISVFYFVPYAPTPEPPDTVEPSENPPLWLGQHPVANIRLGMWEMEVWVWVNNPNGLFEFYNPRFEVDWDER